MSARISDTARAFKDYCSLSDSKTPSVLIFRDGAWRKTALDAMAGSIEPTLQKIFSLNPADIPQQILHKWISSFNSAVSLAQFKSKKIQLLDPAQENIRFNSMNTYRWLSNFFPSIIHDPDNNVIYPTVESGYVAYKARISGCSHEEVLSFSHMIDPKEVKRAGKHLFERVTAADNEAAVKEMERLVLLKFQQNPFLCKWLTRSQQTFEEFTNDFFWGTAMGTINDEDSNQMGKIMGRVRDQLLSQ